MARYANTDKLKTDILMKYKKHWEVPCSSEDRLIQSIVTDLRVLIEKNTTADVAPRAEVIEEYRKKVYAKMGKYTVMGREYIQRIMREVEKEYTEGQK